MRKLENTGSNQSSGGRLPKKSSTGKRYESDYSWKTAMINDNWWRWSKKREEGARLSAGERKISNVARGKKDRSFPVWLGLEALIEIAQQTSEMCNESSKPVCSTDRVLIMFPLTRPRLFTTPVIKINLTEIHGCAILLRVARIFISDRNGSRHVYAWFMKHFPSDPLANIGAIRPLKIERWVVRVSRHNLSPSCQVFDVKRNEERRREILFHFGNEIPGAKGVNWYLVSL